MKLAEIQNGLSFAGRTRNRNYRERACAPNNIQANPSYGQKQDVLAVYKIALRNASKRLAAADEYIKATAKQ